MIKRFLSLLFKGRAIEIPNTASLEEGHANGVNIGDPMADGRRVILCRVDGDLHAIDAECPHQGARIDTGPLHQGKYALCPLHNFLFDPKNGSVIQGACSKATTYRVEEKDGTARLYL